MLNVQDKLRSVLCRPFVRCDDQKGVVEGTTIKKSKSCGKTEQKIEKQIRKDSTGSPDCHKSDQEKMVYIGNTEVCRGSRSSLQQPEVSRGPQKLNPMIGSWSAGMNYNEEPKHIAEDLLKGAFDLQDSLVMLNKLQEVSHFTANVKQMSERGNADETWIENSNTNRFRDHEEDTVVRQPWFSSDGSSRDCHEELRKVIIESFTRQNLLPNRTLKSGHFRGRNMDSACDLPSSNTSQSSVSHANNFRSTDSSLSSVSPPKKGKIPNLIAKLMGLEEFPEAQVKISLSKQFEKENRLSKQSHFFDMDMPKRWTPAPVVQKGDERKTTKEKQFKALLKSTFVKDIECIPRHSSKYHLKQKSIDDFPSIILIEPQRVLNVNTEECEAQIHEEERGKNNYMKFRKPKREEDLLKKKGDHKDGPTASSRILKKVETKETLMKKLSQARAKYCREKVGKSTEKELMNNQKGSTEMKAFGTSSYQLRRSEAVEEKSNKILKVSVPRNQSVNKDIVKSKASSRPHDQVKATLAKAKNPDSRSSISKRKRSLQQRSTRNPILNFREQTIAHNSNDRNQSWTKNEEPMTEPTSTTYTLEDTICKKDENVIYLSSEQYFGLEESDTKLSDQISTKAETDSFEQSMGERRDINERFPSDNLPLISVNEKELKFTEEISTNSSLSGRENKAFKTEPSLKALLLMSPAFLSHAEDLFDIKVNDSTTLPKADNNNDSDQRLLVDCAYELIERRNRTDSETRHWLGKVRVDICLDDLLNEVCDGVEALKHYSKLEKNQLMISDTHYSMLEKDIRCKGVASGIWDFGWRNTLTVDDTDQVVNDIEKLIVSQLIEEVLFSIIVCRHDVDITVSGK